MSGATNSALMRRKNEKIILSLINKEPISRAEIAKKTGLTKAAVTIIVDDLKKREIVTEEKINTSSVGRNPLMLRLSGNSVYMIGINIKRGNIVVGITDLCGRVIVEESFCAPSPAEAFSGIEKTVKKQLKQTGLDFSKIYKAAVVTPGPVDVVSGKILNPPNFAKWHNVCVAEEIEKILDCDVVFDNVSSAVAVAERYFGSAKDSESFMAIQVDEGIGSGIMINDTLFGGSCEIGHISIKYDGKMCDCGNRGCLEKYASIPNLLKNTPHKSWRECVDANDEETMLKEAEFLGTAIITADNIFNLRRVVLCGELVYKPEKLVSLVSKMICDKILLKEKLHICSGSVRSQVLIAASMAIHSFFTE